MQKKKGVIVPILLIIVLLASAIAALFIGVIPITASHIWGSFVKHCLPFVKEVQVPVYEDMVIWQLRFPRIVMSLLAGASLAVGGCVFQSLFRNPICDPYILGISSGASLGATIAIILGWDVWLFGITIPALTTAILTLLLIMGIARIRYRQHTQTLLLTGIALNFFISAIITLLMVINQQEMQKIMFWTMGSLSSVSWQEIAYLAPTLLVVMCVLYYYAKDLNILQLGSESAVSLGVNAQRTTYITLIASSVLMAMVVSFCGVIGFIGLIVPHICRILFGSNNRTLFAYAMIIGALFLLISDTLSRTIAAPSELPVGSITALAGAPYFIYLLLKKR